MSRTFMITLTGILECVTIEIAGAEGLMIKTWIDGEGYTWDFPSVTSEYRTKIFAKLNDAIGCQVSIMSSPPDGFVFKANNSVIQIGKSVE